jgi:hypothetical protein
MPTTGTTVSSITSTGQSRELCTLTSQVRWTGLPSSIEYVRFRKERDASTEMSFPQLQTSYSHRLQDFVRRLSRSHLDLPHRIAPHAKVQNGYQCRKRYSEKKRIESKELTPGINHPRSRLPADSNCRWNGLGNITSKVVRVRRLRSR